MPVILAILFLLAAGNAHALKLAPPPEECATRPHLRQCVEYARFARHARAEWACMNTPEVYDGPAETRQARLEGCARRLLSTSVSPTQPSPTNP